MWISIYSLTVGSANEYKTNCNEVKCDFITSPLHAIFKHILFHGGYEKAIDEIVNGAKSVIELSAETNKYTAKNLHDNIKNNEDNIVFLSGQNGKKIIIGVISTDLYNYKSVYLCDHH